MVEDCLDLQPPPPLEQPRRGSKEAGGGAEEAPGVEVSSGADSAGGTDAAGGGRGGAAAFPFVRSVADLSNGPGSFPGGGGSGAVLSAQAATTPKSAHAAATGGHASPPPQGVAPATTSIAAVHSEGVQDSTAPVVRVPFITESSSDSADVPVATPLAASAEGSGRASLSAADGVLVVQYQLPVRLWYDPDPPGAEPSQPGSRVWHAEWDEEALLSPKHQPGGLRSALAQVRIKWIGTPPIEVEPACEEAGELDMWGPRGSQDVPCTHVRSVSRP